MPIDPMTGLPIPQTLAPQIRTPMFGLTPPPVIPTPTPTPTVYGARNPMAGMGVTSLADSVATTSGLAGRFPTLGAAYAKAKPLGFSPWQGAAKGMPLGKTLVGKGLQGAAVAYGSGLLANQVTTPGTKPHGAITGAGQGAALGMMLGPYGAAAGAVIGGLLGAFGGGDDKNPVENLRDSATQLGLDSEVYEAQFDILKETQGKDAALAAVGQQMITDFQAQQQAVQQRQQYTAQTQVDAKMQMAMQAQAREFFQPYANNIITSGILQAQQLEGIIPGLPEPYRATVAAQAAQALGTSQRLASAYMMQSQLLPSQYMMSQDLKRQTELANLQYQQSVINAQSGGGDFNDLVAQIQSGEIGT